MVGLHFAVRVAILVIPLDGLDPVGVPKDLQAVRFAVHERPPLVQVAVRIPQFPQTGALAGHVVPLAFLLAVGMPHDPVAMGNPVGERQLQLEDSVGVVEHLDSGEQVRGALPVPLSVLPVLQLVIESQGDAVGHALGLQSRGGAILAQRDAVGHSFDLGCRGGTVFSTADSDQGCAGNNKCGEVVH